MSQWMKPFWSSPTDYRTRIPIPELCHLVELCLRSTYFQFGHTFFEQVQGAAAMGSSLSPIVANIFMEDWRLEP